MLKTSIDFFGSCLVRSNSQLLGMYLVELLLLFYFLGKGGVMIIKVVDFLVKLVDVFVDEMVLLFVLEES